MEKKINATVTMLVGRKNATAIPRTASRAIPSLMWRLRHGHPAHGRGGSNTTNLPSFQTVSDRCTLKPSMNKPESRCCRCRLPTLLRNTVAKCVLTIARDILVALVVRQHTPFRQPARKASHRKVHNENSKSPLPGAAGNVYRTVLRGLLIV
jgi:hypothetical protein